MVVDPREGLTPTIAGDVAPEVPSSAGSPLRQSSLWKDAWRRYIRNRAALAAGIVFVLLLLVIVWPIISPYSRTRSTSRRGVSLRASSIRSAPNVRPRSRTRAAVGGRVSIGIGFAATIAILLIGVTYGSISGFAADASTTA